MDVGSLNGTYVNREPVDSAVLANGDEVQIGKFRLVFLTGPKVGDDNGGHRKLVTAPETPALAGCRSERSSTCCGRTSRM